MRDYFYHLATDQRSDLFSQALKVILWLFSQVYGLCVRLVRFLYQKDILKRCSLPRPVICVGNMTLGGVGKTPLVLDIAQFLKRRKCRPVVLTRGYMNSCRFQGLSDEAAELQESLGVPVKVGGDRYRLGMQAVNECPVDVFLLDDGFQHWRLKRDLDIVLIDASNPFGNGNLLPRGILREPLDAFKRVSLVVLTKTDLGQHNVSFLKERLLQINPEISVVETIHRPLELVDIFTDSVNELSFLNARKVCVVCAIGAPKSFEHSLESLGAEVQKMFVFMDHHRYQSVEVEDMVRFCQEQKIDTVITTQKDSVKLKPLLEKNALDIRFFALRIHIEFIRGQNEFYERISRLCHR